MAHQRKLIRHAVVAALTGTTSAGTRVKNTPIEPNRGAGLLPAIGVYTLTEETDSDDAMTAPRELWREMDLHVECWAAATATTEISDALDDMAEQIEAAMDVDRYFGGVAADSILTSTNIAIPLENRADPIVGCITLTYQITYRTSPATNANLADYLRTGATTQIDGAGADNAVNDLFNQRP